MKVTYIFITLLTAFSFIKAMEINESAIKKLLRAARKGNLDLAAQAFDEGGFYINTREENTGYTPLHLAALNGHHDVVQLLINNGFDLKAREEDGYTPLHLAARNGYIDVVQLLINNGADPDARNQDGYTPLHLAARNGYPAIVQLLINLGATVDLKSSDNWRPLHFAARNGYLFTVQLLIGHGANPHARTSTDNTPLHLAARNGYPAIVQWLIDHGADPNARNEDDDTPLHLAALNGYHNVIEILIDHGADPNARNQDGNTPLHEAIRKGTLDIIELLITHGADVFIVSQGFDSPLRSLYKNHYKNDPILRAITSFDIDTANWYLRIYRQGTRPTQSDINEINRALSLASALGQTAIVARILTNFESYLPQSIFHHAPVASASQGHLDVVRLLFNHPSLNQEQLTLTLIIADTLYWAALNRHIEVVGYLLHQALVAQRAPALTVTRAGRAITSLLTTPNVDWPEGAHEKLITIHELLAYVLRLRLVAGKEGISNITSALAQKITPALPPELFALTLGWLLRPPQEKHFEST